MNHYEIALSLSPENQGILVNMGIAYMRREMYLKAKDCFQKALDIDETFAPAQSGLRKVNEKLKWFDFYQIIKYTSKYCTGEWEDPVRQLLLILSID